MARATIQGGYKFCTSLLQFGPLPSPRAANTFVARTPFTFSMPAFFAYWVPIASWVVLTTPWAHAANPSHATAALRALQQHTATQACASTLQAKADTTSALKNVFRVHDDAVSGQALYFILWQGDMDCSGGSGSDSYYLSAVGRSGPQQPWQVYHHAAWGEALMAQLPMRFVTQLQQTQHQQFVLTALSHAPDDASNFPTLLYRFTIGQQPTGWQITHRQFLGRVSP